MGKTIIEKIIQAHSDEPVEAGKIVWMAEGDEAFKPAAITAALRTVAR